MKYCLRMTEAQHSMLRSHLFPGDGNEAVALLVCGRRVGTTRHIFLVQQVVLVPHHHCDRQPDRITWPTDSIDRIVRETFGRGLAIVKVHSHDTGYRQFSSLDDESDISLFSSISSLLDDGLPHASMIMFPDGELIGRVLDVGGGIGENLDSAMVVGDDIRIWSNISGVDGDGAFSQRHAQAFGKGTTALLRTLTVAVIGCSGTGSVVVEQLSRLGVGRLILVDPDTTEEKNLNRILNSTKEDARSCQPKVHVLAAAIRRLELEQEVLAIPANLLTPEAV